MARNKAHIALASLCVFFMSGCEHRFSPNIYSSNAVQLANVVDAGIVAGFREVTISANGNIGAVTGGAAGGVLGAQYAGALAAVGTTALGLVAGSALDRAAGDTTGWEYIVRKDNGDMVSVTQREKTPLALGQKVLVIMGPQARVVADYSTAPEPPPVAAQAAAESKPEPVRVELVLTLAPGVAAQLPNGQMLVAQPVPIEIPSAEIPSAPAAVVTEGQPAESAPESFEFISTAPNEAPADDDALKTLEVAAP